jgi:hypothetical protein
MSQHLQKLKDLYVTRKRITHPNFPVEYIAIPKYTDKTANGLTKAIVDFLNLSGHQGERISSMGRMLDKTKIVKDVMGINRTIGSKQYIKGTSTNGTADISSTIQVEIGGRYFGLSVKWEVKIGKDRQSTDQKTYQANIEKSGGIYHIVKSFDDFYEKYLLIINNK